MIKAKSRLSNSDHIPRVPPTLEKQAVAQAAPPPQTKHSTIKDRQLLNHLNSGFKNSSQLFASATSFWALYLLMSKFYPHQLANIPMAGTFAPLMLPMFSGCFFLCSYVFKSSRIGLFSALLASIVFFLRLQQVIIH